jgi:hypothetical protein
MASQTDYADVEIRILAKDATGYPVEITVQTATGITEALAEGRVWVRLQSDSRTYQAWGA